MSYGALRVSFQDSTCRAQIYRPEANNTINGQLISELERVISICVDDNRSPAIKALVIEGLPDVFCTGADLTGLSAPPVRSDAAVSDPEPLYQLWLSFTRVPFLVISLVRGHVNAGGIGFLAASDVVIADKSARFSLSELLFGLLPACVMPFLIRRTGFQKANYLALTTWPISTEEARDCGLVDAAGEDAEAILRKHLVRFCCLSRNGIARYKGYMSRLDTSVFDQRQMALAANREAFANRENIEGIRRFVTEGKFPWEP